MTATVSNDNILSSTSTLQYAAQGFTELGEAFWVDSRLLTQLRAQFRRFGCADVLTNKYSWAGPFFKSTS
jgi:hypothetical protein